MGAITAESVAIAELVVYIPTALVTIWVVLRHGTHKQLGWIYLAIFCGIRIAGSVFEILSHNNPSNSSDEEWALILQSVGLSPLLLSTLGLLKRVFDEVSGRVPSGKNFILNGISQTRGIAGRVAGIYTKRATAASRRSRAVQLLHLPALIALILAISGGSDEFSSDVTQHAGGRTKVRAAIILYLMIYLATFFLWIVTLRDFSSMRKSQTRIFLCVMVAIPFIGVRVLYSLISDFGNSPQFNLVKGDEGIRIGMALVEEFVIVVMYTVLGVVTPKFVGDVERGRTGDVEEQEAYDVVYGPQAQGRDGRGRRDGR
ncbi:hypothetical protein GE09DRAFT_1181850 [Coniochaeta sp. 2T2.1]|nr:hypothetical protein GE09DRAFT_1181850 [Coniochaeta sp. 2T2.1]